MISVAVHIIGLLLFPSFHSYYFLDSSISGIKYIVCSALCLLFLLLLLLLDSSV